VAVKSHFFVLQSIGFVGPGVSLLCLSFAKTPAMAALLMTIALSLSSFSQAGYFCNVQVSSLILKNPPLH
jgi:MFS transporter, ACS family, solute carrier family 17 (sodium-dependent inorganic phosphate cotransporter), other